MKNNTEFDRKRKQKQVNPTSIQTNGQEIQWTNKDESVTNWDYVWMKNYDEKHIINGKK